MKKIIKFICGVFGLLILLIFGVGIYISTINPNELKPQLISEVKKHTGRDLVISGDIKWRFFPTLGLSIEGLALKNPTGFEQEDMVSFSRAEMSVEIVPLLSKKVNIGVARLDDAKIFVQTLANGTNNLQFEPEVVSNEKPAAEIHDAPVAEPVADKTTEKSPITADENSTVWQISIAGLEIKQASAIILDDQNASKINMKNMNLDVGEFGFGFWVPIQFDLVGQQNQLTFSSKGSLALFINQEDVLSSRLRNIDLIATAKDKTFELQNAKVKINEFGLDHTASVKLNAAGQTEQLGFSTEGEIQVRLEKESERIEITQIDLNAVLDGEDLPRKKITLALTGDAIWDGKEKQLDLEKLGLKANEIEVQGVATVEVADIPKIRFMLDSKLIDIDEFMGTKEAMMAKAQQGEAESSVLAKENATVSQTQVTEASSPSVLSRTEPDLSGLKGLDIEGKITISQFIAANIHVENVIAQFAINRGEVKIDKFDAALYGGTVTTKARLNANTTPADFSLIQKVSSVQALPLLKDATGKAFLEGNGNININLVGKGLSPYLLRKAIKGQVGIHFKDGALYGVNIPEMIREAKAALKGKRAEYVEEAKKTDFSGLEARFSLANGIAKTENVKLEAPLLRVRSEGETNLIKESLDFSLFVSVVGTSKGQGGKDVDKVRDLTVPVAIFGTWLQPDYKIDLKSFLKANIVIQDKLKEKAEKGLQKLLGDKVNNEEINKVTENLLNGLFN